MAKEKFVTKNFRKASLDQITLVNAILAEYAADGYQLSLRQLYYQLVARGHIENSEESYKKTGSLVTDGRMAGLIDWDMIVDRNRETESPSHWAGPAEILTAVARDFAIDKWADQPNHVEVMVEKDALSGVLAPVCQELDINFTANKGYPSASLLYELAGRLSAALDRGKDVYIIHLGDHDPSGIDMTRDLIDRLQLFTGEPVCVQRMALNLDQVRELNPPPNPAKNTDTRFKAYLAQFGATSWELDAIEPRQLAALVTGAVETLRDDNLWFDALDQESDMREELRKLARDFE